MRSKDAHKQLARTSLRRTPLKVKAMITRKKFKICFMFCVFFGKPLLYSKCLSFLCIIGPQGVQMATVTYGHIGKISVRGLHSTDQVQRGPYGRDRGLIFPQDGPEQAWLRSDLLHDIITEKEL